MNSVGGTRNAERGTRNEKTTNPPYVPLSGFCLSLRAPRSAFRVSGVLSVMPPEDVHSEPVPPPAPEAPPSREPVLLTPFRLPAQSALYLGNEDVACFLNGYLALWHPAVLLRASTLPRTESPYDHEQPTGTHLYALPENPPLMLPDEWQERAKAAGEVYFRATPERPSTLANLREALFAHSTREGAAPDAEVPALLHPPAARGG